MDSILIPWTTGNGNIVVKNTGGSVTIASDTPNEHIDRTQSVRFYTTKGINVAEQSITVNQVGKRVVLRDNTSLILRDKKGKILTALK